MSNDGLLSIGEVAEAAGLRTSALRYYEDVGLIRPDARIGGKRHYRPTVLRRLAMIALCQEVGFTVGEIADFLAGVPKGRARWREMSERKLAELDAHIEKARRTRRLLQEALDCGCGDPASCERVASTGRGRVRSAKL